MVIVKSQLCERDVFALHLHSAVTIWFRKSVDRLFMAHSLAIILAAGEGTRMKSDLPKVLHQVAHRSMLGHVLAAVTEAGIERVAVVVSPDRPHVADEARRHRPDALIVEQKERLGTAHAALQAKAALEADIDAAIVLFADTPLVSAGIVKELIGAAKSGAAVAALGFEAADPTGYGRLIIKDDVLIANREHKDASDAQRRITLCNAGLMAFAGKTALSLLQAISNDNVQKEFYLPDAIEIAIARNLPTTWRVAAQTEVQGVNDRVQLAAVEAVMQQRLRETHMRSGVTMVDPASVYLSYDTIIGRDVTIEPHCVFGPGVRIFDHALIHAFSSLEGTVIETGVSVGPYARLRPGAHLMEGSRVGNFVEVKGTTLGKGSKANHLTYLGDSVIGAGVNIGAGTITCNYDGFDKFKTVIEDGVFVGSNSSLVAPVTLREGAIIGSGSVITANVEADALALGRARQTDKPGWAKPFRAAKLAAKAAKKKTV
jgi:bifunctional UDP-N-acetylglucosamine pyrophosphorylase / glucosamine-1-phosphate N-acetyltransferase